MSRHYYVLTTLLLAFISINFCTGFIFGDTLIDKAKNSKIANNSNLTFGEVFQNYKYFSDQKWTEREVNGIKFVQFEAIYTGAGIYETVIKKRYDFDEETYNYFCNYLGNLPKKQFIFAIFQFENNSLKTFSIIAPPDAKTLAGQNIPLEFFVAQKPINSTFIVDNYYKYNFYKLFLQKYFNMNVTYYSKLHLYSDYFLLAGVKVNDISFDDTKMDVVVNANCKIYDNIIKIYYKQNKRDPNDTAYFINNNKLELNFNKFQQLHDGNNLNNILLKYIKFDNDKILQEQNIVFRGSLYNTSFDLHRENEKDMDIGLKFILLSENPIEYYCSISGSYHLSKNFNNNISEIVKKIQAQQDKESKEERDMELRRYSSIIIPRAEEDSTFEAGGTQLLNYSNSDKMYDANLDLYYKDGDNQYNFNLSLFNKKDNKTCHYTGIATDKDNMLECIALDKSANREYKFGFVSRNKGYTLFLSTNTNPFCDITSTRIPFSLKKISKLTDNTALEQSKIQPFKNQSSQNNKFIPKPEDLNITKLTDDEYKGLKESSKKFREADARLNFIWNEIRKHMNEDEKKRLLSDQRKWINIGWAEEASKLMSQKGLARNQAFTEALIERVKFLEGLKAGHSNGSDTQNAIEQFIGKVEMEKREGQTGCYLVQKSGQIIFLGYADDIAKRPEQNCIISAAKNGNEITITGENTDKSESIWYFIEDNFRCLSRSTK